MAQGSRALQGAAAQAALAKAAGSSMASVVLADPSQQPNSGLVLSLAPLMGAAAQVDSSHPKWLHVHVRPPVRGLLKLLKVCGMCAAASCFVVYRHLAAWKLVAVWVNLKHVRLCVEVRVQQTQACGCIH